MITSYALVVENRQSLIELRAYPAITGWSSRLVVDTDTIINGSLDVRGGTVATASFSGIRDSSGKRFELQLVNPSGTAFTVLSGMCVDGVIDPTPRHVDVYPGSSNEPSRQFVHTQNTPSAAWTINHGLDRWPAVTIVDSAGTEVEGSVTHVDSNNVMIEFSAAFSGQAFIGG